MGIFKSAISSSKYDINYNYNNGNPKPNNYKIIRYHEENDYLLMEINYPDCKNYEGNKILLFKGIKLLDIINQKIIDPHFSDNKEIHHPIARFIPNNQGWDMALNLIN